MSSESSSLQSPAAPRSAALPAAKKCLCQVLAGKEDYRLPWDYSVLCSACCKRALRPHWQRHEEALVDRDIARERCAQKLASLRNLSLSNQISNEARNLSELQFESQRLRDRRTKLQQQCSSLAVEVAAHAVENEEKRESLNPQAELHREQLQRLDQSVCEGSMKQAIDTAREQIRLLRFQWALKAFAMHRLVVRAEDVDYGEEDGLNAKLKEAMPGETPQTRSRHSRLSKEGRQKQARGIGKIGGLPLPHAGPELYGVLPPQELQSALRLVASITCTVARCLGIKLPHPVLLHPSNSFKQGDIIYSAVMENESTEPAKHSSSQDSDPTSTASLLSLLGTPLEDASDGIINQYYHSQNRGSTSVSGRQPGLEERANTTAVPPSMEPSLVTKRLNYATAAVLAEADPSSKNATSSISDSPSQYALAADMMYEDEFAIALQLLQNDVIVLCIRSGVPVDKLFPAEAVLLNLYALQLFCEDQIKDYIV